MLRDPAHHSNFVFKKTKKANFRFFLNEGQKTKGFDSKLPKFCHYYLQLILFPILSVYPLTKPLSWASLLSLSADLLPQPLS
jgi:hypothetical protein